MRRLIGSEMWWLIGSASDFWGRGTGTGFKSGISHNDLVGGAAGSLCITVKSQGRRDHLQLRQRKERKEERK